MKASLASRRAREEQRTRAKAKEHERHKAAKHKRRRKHHKAAHHRTAVKPHGTLGVALPVAPSSPPAPSPAPPATVGSPPITLAQARRLLWRAGFGPTPGQAEALVGQPLEQVVFGLTRPSGPATLTGPEPVNEEGKKLEPEDVWGDDHCWWLDRMIRSDQQLVERMTFIFHDWFANSNEKVNSQRMMLEQNELFRSMCFGSFHDLFLAVTTNPAMLVFLDGIYNEKGNTNENYGREMMELFSLGADRGAYTQDDVHEMGRALTGWRAEWTESAGLVNFHYDPDYHDDGVKTIFGQSGNWDYEDAVRLCVEHPLHASFFVTKLWGYFIPSEPDEATLASLAGPLRRLRLLDPRGRRGDPPAPRLLRRPRAGHAARRLQRGPAALDRPPDRHDLLGLAVGERRPAAVLPAERLRLGLRRLAGHLDDEGALGNGQLRDVEDLREPLAGGRANRNTAKPRNRPRRSRTR